jgi:methionyl-tRNA formyltransferase
MRIVYLGNNWVGWQILSYLKKRKEDIVGLVLHPQEKSRYRDEMVEAARLGQDYMFEGQHLKNPQTINAIRALQPDIGISVLFDYILEPHFLELFPCGVVNLHPAFLPYNRGQYPNVWSIVEETPAGVTMHYMDAGVDTGDIIAQRQVSIEPFDTGKSLYQKLEQGCIELFKATWPKIRSGRAPRIPQKIEAGTHHITKDVEDIDAIDLDKMYRAKDLIDIIRARTFGPYPGAYFTYEGRRIYLRLELLDEEAVEGGGNGSVH